MVEAQTWRELLRQILLDSQERQRVAIELGVNVVTLTRWTSGVSQPRSLHLRRLLDALPEYREQLSILLSKEYSSFMAGDEAATNFSPEASSEIPSAFYARVLHAHMMNPIILRFSTIMTLVLQQTLSHLDPYALGMKIVLVCCVPSASEEQTFKIRSLREVAGYATPPWSKYTEYQGVMLGAESLPGYATVAGRTITINDHTQWRSIFPLDQDAYENENAYENSIVASPLIRTDRVAGCVTITSTQPDYFTQARLDLIQRYTQLLLLAFDEASFYPLSDLELGVMPPAEVQRPVLQSFRQRVAEVLLKSAREHQSIDLQRAEKIVWKQLEKEFLAKSLDLAKSSN